MKRLSKAIWLLLFIPALASCGKQELSYRDYVKYLNDPANGLIKEKYVGGLKLTVRYLPPEYLAYLDARALDDVKKDLKDSLTDSYRYSRNFLLTIAPDDRPGKEVPGDVMMAGVSNYAEFKSRAFAMNFEMEDLISLKTDKGIFAPSLTNMENVYGLQKGRNINICFSPEGEKQVFEKCGDLDLVYRDDEFGAGINHFVFRKEDIENTPVFKF